MGLGLGLGSLSASPRVVQSSRAQENVEPDQLNQSWFRCVCVYAHISNAKVMLILVRNESSTRLTWGPGRRVEGS